MRYIPQEWERCEVQWKKSLSVIKSNTLVTFTRNEIEGIHEIKWQFPVPF